MFTPTEDGQFLVNDALAAEREDAEARMRSISHARSEAGKRGNEKRWGSQNRKPSLGYRKLSQRTEPDMTAQAKPCASASAEGARSGSSTSDPRHKLTELRIKQRHKEKFAIDCQWDGSDGRALALMLKGNQGWTQEQLNSMVDHLFASKKNYGRPRGWLKNLASWADGPKDQFGATMTPGGKADAEAVHTEIGAGWGRVLKQQLIGRGLTNGVRIAGSDDRGVVSQSEQADDGTGPQRIPATA